MGAGGFVDDAGGHAVGGFGRDKEMVDPQPLILWPAARLIIPKAIGAAGIGVEGAEGITIAKIENSAKLGAAFGTEQGIATPAFGVEHVLVLRDNVEITAKDNWHFLG